MRITIPGLPPPEDARSACDTLRPRYSRAVILVLAAYNGNAYANLRTIVIYGTTRLRPGRDVSLTMPAEGPRQDCFLVRRTVNTADADAFISQAITGSAAPPTTANDIGYRLESWWEGFLPRNSLDLRPSPSPTTSLWRRRRQPSKPGLFGTELSMATVSELLSRVPELPQADWNALDLHSDVSAFEALDEYYLVPVRVETRHRSSSIEANVIDPDNWLPNVNGATLRTEGRRFGLRQTASTLPISAAGTYAVPLHEPTAETLLEADGILLDVSGGSFLGAPHSVPPISGGVLPDVFGLNALTDLWNKRDVVRRDVVLDPRLRGSDPAASGHAAMRKVIGLVGGLIDPVTLDILDPFAVGAATLRAIATMLPQGSRIRLVCGEGSDDANFAAVASETGVAIECYKPPVSIPQHDRFLRLRERLWSVGSSLNHLGYNFSAIIDVRDPVTFGEIASVMDACISGIPEAMS